MIKLTTLGMSKTIINVHREIRIVSILRASRTPTKFYSTGPPIVFLLMHFILYFEVMRGTSLLDDDL